jgi:hypothetical protein
MGQAVGPSVKSLGRFVKDYAWLGTVLVAVGTAVWAIVTYLQNAKLEYLKDFNGKQISTLFTVAETVSSLVAEADQQKWNDHIRAFWTLHYGDLVLLENPGIECAMTYFGAKLNSVHFQDRHQLATYAFSVSSELRKFIKELNANEWRINLATLTGAKNEISPALGLKGEPTTFEFSADIKKRIDGKCHPYVAPPADSDSENAGSAPDRKP